MELKRSIARDVHAEDLAWFAGNADFHRPATDFAIGDEPLVRNARINSHLKGLPTERTLDGFLNLHPAV